MTQSDVISSLMARGMSEEEATAEFAEIVNWYLRGTGYTPADREYAVELAISDFEAV